MKPIRMLLLIVFLSAPAVAGVPTNIDPTNKFSWSETKGWMNWFDADGGAEGVFVDAANGYLVGFVWGENSGWLNLGDGNGPYDKSQQLTDRRCHGCCIRTARANPGSPDAPAAGASAPLDGNYCGGAENGT